MENYEKEILLTIIILLAGMAGWANKKFRQPGKEYSIENNKRVKDRRIQKNKRVKGFDDKRLKQRREQVYCNNCESYSYPYDVKDNKCPLCEVEI